MMTIVPSRRAKHLAAAILLLAALLLISCSSGSSSEGVNALPKSIAAADETNAIQTLRTIASAQSQARVTRGTYSDFQGLAQGGFLDDRFNTSSPLVQGYRFTMTVKDTEFAVNADPQASGPTANSRSRHLYLDSTDNVIHVNPSQTAGRSDPSL